MTGKHYVSNPIETQFLLLNGRINVRLDMSVSYVGKSDPLPGFDNEIKRLIEGTEVFATDTGSLFIMAR